MTDEDILIFFKKYKSIKWNKLPDDIYKYLKERYNDNSSNNIKESYLRILNHIDIVPKCPICGKSLKFNGHSKNNFYHITCGNIKCSNKLRKQHIEEYNLLHYGVKETWQRNDVKETCQKIWKEKYGVINPFNIKEVQEKRIKNSRSEEANKKRKETCLKKYGVENGGGSQEAINKIKEKWKNKSKNDIENINKQRKETCLKKYGLEYYQSTEEFKKNISTQISSEKCLNKRKQTTKNKYGVEVYNNQDKRFETMKKNNSYKKSKPEDKSYELLKEKFKEVKRQYRSDLYPFNCDFYIPSLDLYIECNYSQFHNKHPFDQNNKDDIKLLEELKEKANKSKRHKECKKSQYDMMIYVWTDLDIRKRDIAINNNLNYKIFWNIKELKEWLNNQ